MKYSFKTKINIKINYKYPIKNILMKFFNNNGSRYFKWLYFIFFFE